MENVKTLPNARQRMYNISFLLFCLCLLDAIFTDIGLRNGFIQEANPFMRSIYSSSILLFYVVKTLLPLSLLYLSTILQPKLYLRFMMIGALILYVIILSSHLLWIILISLKIG